MSLCLRTIGKEIRDRKKQSILGFGVVDSLSLVRKGDPRDTLNSCINGRSWSAGCCSCCFVVRD